MPYLRGTVSQSSGACFCCAGAGEGEGVIFESICKKPRIFETRDCEKPVPYLKGTMTCLIKWKNPLCSGVK